jgi:hypothetical protein
MTMKRSWLATTFFAIALGPSAVAQTQTVDRTAKGEPGKDIRVGVYVNVRQDCTSGPLPTIRLTAKPENGTVTVKKAKVSATNYKQCLAMEVPGYVAFYRSKPNFIGTDVLNLEVTFPGGKTEVQKITVNVGSGSPGQGI